VSAFKTVLTVDLGSITRLLPKDYTIEKIAFDHATSEVVVLWQTSAIETPYTFPLDFTVADLEAKKLPQHAKLSERRVKPSVPSNVVKVPGAVIPPRPVKPGRSRRNTVKVEV
jgi:hypothetical protein